MRYPTRPSKRRLRLDQAFLSMAKTGVAPEVPEAVAPTRKRGKQPESAVGEANRKAARLMGGVLYANRRGMFRLADGSMRPYGLGPNGMPDAVGYLPVTITPDLLGRKVAVFWAPEWKTDEGVVAPHQQAIIDELRDAGAISGVARNPGELQDMVERWRRG